MSAVILDKYLSMMMKRWQGPEATRMGKGGDCVWEPMGPGGGESEGWRLTFLVGIPLLPFELAVPDWTGCLSSRTSSFLSAKYG